ncbi:MAG: DUF4258 domain-containing protein [Acidobacteria bacterium]|nr:DUF4258 domain-containing protein [Acidobacteriota bacterium]
MDKPIPFTPEEAKQCMLEILRDGEVRPTSHCLNESMPKRGVTIRDILTALRSGEIKRPAEWDNEHAEWKYRVEGEDTDGDELTAITVILTTDMRLVIVPVF